MSPSPAIYQRIFRDIPTITSFITIFWYTQYTPPFLTDMDLPKMGDISKNLPMLGKWWSTVDARSSSEISGDINHLKNDGVRELGWWNSKYMEWKIKHVLNHQPDCIYIYNFIYMWWFSSTGDPQFMDGLFHGKSILLKWMITRSPWYPVIGNLVFLYPIFVQLVELYFAHRWTVTFSAPGLRSRSPDFTKVLSIDGWTFCSLSTCAEKPSEVFKDAEKSMD